MPWRISRPGSFKKLKSILRQLHCLPNNNNSGYGTVISTSTTTIITRNSHLRPRNGEKLERKPNINLIFKIQLSAANLLYASHCPYILFYCIYFPNDIMNFRSKNEPKILSPQDSKAKCGPKTNIPLPFCILHLLK